jgi:antitoxin component YwqK of YwqJK toxin-antitoxin module
MIQSLLLMVVVACTSIPFEAVEETFPDGSPKVVRYYKSETKEVMLKETQYYQDGAKYIEGDYKNGKRNGKWMAWHPNGNVWSIGYYKKGVEVGLKTVFHENGNKYYEGKVDGERRIGKWTFWDEEGEEIKSINYDQQ